MVRIAINGFGRIGRLTTRNLLKKEGIELVAINDLTDKRTLAHLFKYDSAQGIFPGELTSDDTHININGRRILALSERDPSKLPWKDLDVDIVLECTGVFRTRELAMLHVKAGARKVLLSAPAKSEGVKTLVKGVNEHEADSKELIFSNASCTTNCLAPLVKLIDEAFGLLEGHMTTVHGYTADQRLQDAPHRDLRRARAAAVNIIPTTTGAAKALGLVYPSAKGKLDAMAVRVPVITGSLIDLNCNLYEAPSKEEVLTLVKTAAEGPLKGIVSYCEAPIVSSDIVGNPHSSIFDASLTTVHGHFLHIISWYDNEAGYSARLADMAVFLSGLS